MKRKKKGAAVIAEMKQSTSFREIDLIKKVSAVSERAEKARLSSTYNQTKFYKV